jgi:anti-anti-sigma factor
MDDRTVPRAGWEPFRCEIASTAPPIRVRAIGELDIASAPELRRCLAGARGAPRVVLDLRCVTFIDSTGITLLLDEERYARATGTQFVLIPGPAQVQRVLTIAGVLNTLSFTGEDD